MTEIHIQQIRLFGPFKSVRAGAGARVSKNCIIFTEGFSYHLKKNYSDGFPRAVDIGSHRGAKGTCHRLSDSVGPAGPLEPFCVLLRYHKKKGKKRAFKGRRKGKGKQEKRGRKQVRGVGQKEEGRELRIEN